MTLIHCTQKLLKELGNPPVQTSTNEKTLYSNRTILKGTHYLHPIEALRALLLGEIPQIPKLRLV
ncbi:MAG: hypothetical protein C0402_00710 [Thermodesulfovibrio sp.]|nr:hypothetical protein [Thermodesulfovibrio sp.]